MLDAHTRPHTQVGRVHKPRKAHTEQTKSANLFPSHHRSLPPDYPPPHTHTHAHARTHTPPRPPTPAPPARPRHLLQRVRRIAWLQDKLRPDHRGSRRRGTHAGSVHALDNTRRAGEPPLLTEVRRAVEVPGMQGGPRRVGGPTDVPHPRGAYCGAWGGGGGGGRGGGGKQQHRMLRTLCALRKRNLV